MPAQQDNEVMVSVSALIRKGHQILLEKRAHTHGAGTWGPPTGHPDFGEAPEQTAVRETQEETGITISDVKFRAITNDLFETEHYHILTIWMDATYVSGKPAVRAPEEESEVGWFPLDALPEPLYLPFANLLAGRAYPTQEELIGGAVELPSDIAQAESTNDAV